MPLRVALIDDDAVQLQIYQRQLTKMGANVTCFSSGSDFLKKQPAVQNSTAWDLVVVDYLMPQMNGVQMISCLPVQASQKTLVCMLTGGTLETRDQSYLQNRGLMKVQKARSACEELWGHLLSHRTRLAAPIQVFPPHSLDPQSLSTSVMLVHKRTAIITTRPQLRIPAAFTLIPTAFTPTPKCLETSAAPESGNSDDSKKAPSPKAPESLPRYLGCIDLRRAAAKVKARQPRALQPPKLPRTMCGQPKKSLKRRPKLAQVPEAPEEALEEEAIQVIPVSTEINQRLLNQVVGELETEHIGFELHIAGVAGEAQQQGNCSAEDQSIREDCQGSAAVTREAQQFTGLGLETSVAPLQIPELEGLDINSNEEEV